MGGAIYIFHAQFWVYATVLRPQTFFWINEQGWAVSIDSEEPGALVSTLDWDPPEQSCTSPDMNIHTGIFKCYTLFPDRLSLMLISHGNMHIQYIANPEM